MDQNNTRHAELIERIRSLSRPLEPIATDAPHRTPAMPEVRAVLWDVYGTLIISGSGDIGVLRAQDNVGALADALAELGIEAAGDPRDVAARGIELVAEGVEAGHAARRQEGIEFPEIDIRTVWQEVLGGLRDEGRIPGNTGLDPAAIDRLAVEYECRVNPVWPMPGAAELLRWLPDAHLALGVVSNAQFFTPLVIEALLGGPPGALGFRDELCVFSYERLEAKPSTRLFELALDRLAASDGLRPEQVLYVGNDVRNDVRPAAAVGCRTALFAGDQRSWRPRTEDPGCAGVEPDAVIHRLDELRPMLGG